MLNGVFWLVFGLLVGWIATIVTSAGPAHQKRLMAASVMGGLVGGSIVLHLHKGFIVHDYNPSSIFGAVALALLFAALTHVFCRKDTQSN